ncbi:MAG: hypothetical protein IJ682_12945 [Lachnospiraceae bacterium]|nr:hypothetical protein [Lachnospiraceae bacterium]
MFTRKGVSVFAAVLAVTVLLTGCMRIGGEIDTTKSAKKYTESVTVWFNKAKVDGYAAGGGSTLNMSGSDLDASDISSFMTEIQKYPVVTIGGKEYYKSETQKTKESYYKGKGKADPIVTRSSIYSADASETVGDSVSEDLDSAEAYMSEILERIVIKVKFKDKIAKTNGKLSKDKRTAIFSYDVKALNKVKEIYAYTTSAKRTLKQDRKTAKGAGKN